MKYNKDIMKKTEFLFDRNFIAELNGTNNISEKEENKYNDCLKELCEEYEWNEVFACWEFYLYNNCKTAKMIYNFANLFWEYAGYQNYIPEPYKFLAYFYYKEDPKRYEEEMNAFTIMDSLSIEILHRAGITGVTNTENPYYDPQEDVKMIEAINKWKNGEYK